MHEIGVERIRPHLEDFLDRAGTRLRIVTGDYLDLSDPDALAILLDLASAHTDDRVQIRIFESSNQSFHPRATSSARASEVPSPTWGANAAR